MDRGYVLADPFRALIALVLGIAFVVGPFAIVHAQDATPGASPAAVGSWVGQEPDLAAMTLTPADLEEIGQPGFGKYHNGHFLSLEQFTGFEADYFGKPVEEVRALFERIGWSRQYVFRLGLPSVPGEDSPPEREFLSRVMEVADAEGAGAYIDFTMTPGPESGWTIESAEAPFSLGDRAVVYRASVSIPEAGLTTTEHYVRVQLDNLIAIVGFAIDVPDPEGTPEASPVADGSGEASPAATVEELESVARRQLEKMGAVISNGSPNLSSLLLRLGDDPVAAAADYREGYRLLKGDLPPYYADFEDDILADPAAVGDADAVYELGEFFLFGEEESPTEDHYFLNRLYRFPDEAAAEAFMASRPDALATGGYLLWSGATEEAGSDLLPGEAQDLGDESLAFDFVRAFDDGMSFEGYEIYVRVGEMVAAVSLEGPPDLELAQVEEIAAAQAACLEAGECPEAFPVPETFYAPLDATPEATPAA